MDGFTTDAAFVIEELSQEELENRRFRAASSKPSGRPSSKARPSKSCFSALSRNRTTGDDPISSTQSSTELNHETQSSVPEAPSHSLSPSGDALSPIEIILEERKVLNLAALDWPGHITDIDFLIKEKDEYSASREGHLVVDLISHLIFLWGLSPSPLQSMKQAIDVEIASSNCPPQSAPPMFVFEDESDSDEPISTQEDLVDTSTDVQVDEFGIEVHTEPKKSNRPKIKLDDDADADELFEEPEAKPSRLQLRRLEKQQRQVDSVVTQLETLRRLIFEDVHQPTPTRQHYLSHIFLFVGSSARTSKFSCCLVRQLHESATDSTYHHDENASLPAKTRADDTWIRSKLRLLLQKDIGTSSIRQSRSRMTNRISLVIAYSAAPSATNGPLLSESAVNDEFTPIQLPQECLTKWNPKKPIKSIRIGFAPHDPPSPTPSPVFFTRIGDPIYLL